MRMIDADALERVIMTMPDEELCEDCCYNVVNAIDEAPTVGGWISVKDRLPEEQEQIIIDSVSIVTHAIEKTDEFIFKTVEPYCEQVTERKISKKILERALTEYFKNHPKEADDGHNSD